jgi:hypothetical protein
MILDIKGHKQESAMKQKCVLWSLCLTVHNWLL